MAQAATVLTKGSCVDTFTRQKYVARRVTLLATVKCRRAMEIRNMSHERRYVAGFAIRRKGAGGGWAQRIFCFHWSFVRGQWLTRRGNCARFHGGTVSY